MSSAQTASPSSGVRQGVHWAWAEQADGWEPLETQEEFGIEIDYRESGFTIRGLRFNAVISLQPGITARVVALRSAEPYTGAIIENILRTLVSYDATGKGGLLLHSACFTNGRSTWLVFGHSGAGKSTCSEFAAEVYERIDAST
jgi:hypothetical protein